MNTATFEKQLEYMKSHYSVIGAQQLYDLLQEKNRFPKKAAMITFDDGYKDNFKNAYPILKKHGIPATMFLTSGPIDRREPFWWEEIGCVASRIFAETKKKEIVVDASGRITCRPDGIPDLVEQLKDVPNAVRKNMVAKLIDEYSIEVPPSLVEEQVLTWDEAREMAEGGIHFGAHTVDHPILAKLAIEEACNQIRESRDCVRKHLGEEVFSFAYPNGKREDYNQEITAYLKRTGFKAAFTTIPSINGKKTDAMEMGRIVAPFDMGRFEFLLSGFSGDLNKAR